MLNSLFRNDKMSDAKTDPLFSEPVIEPQGDLKSADVERFEALESVAQVGFGAIVFKCRFYSEPVCDRKLDSAENLVSESDLAEIFFLYGVDIIDRIDGIGPYW